MKNSLLKFAGLFVEKIPVDEVAGSAKQTPRPPSPAPAPVAAQPGQGSPNSQRPGQPALDGPAPLALQGHFPTPSGHVALPRTQAGPVQHGVGAMPVGAPSIAIALRAWVPQEYAAVLAPFGLHVIAAGGELTVEQALTWGAHVLVVSAECLGSHTHLLVHPQLPTVFITPQPMTLPDAPGVLQVQEPLRASEVANAAREAMAAWSSARS
jgi:hypothetical protein